MPTSPHSFYATLGMKELSLISLEGRRHLELKMASNGFTFFQLSVNFIATTTNEFMQSIHLFSHHVFKISGYRDVDDI
jgi:hypothetical protein